MHLTEGVFFAEVVADELPPSRLRRATSLVEGGYWAVGDVRSYGACRGWLECVGIDVLICPPKFAQSQTDRSETCPFNEVGRSLESVGTGIARPRTTNGRPYILRPPWIRFVGVDAHIDPQRKRPFLTKRPFCV